MPTDLTATGVISHAIQLAIAPVFLLTGIASLLGVMATRLARVIDRARHLQVEWTRFNEAERLAARSELAMLERRRRVCSWSINCCTAAALFVCVVIMALFVEAMLAAELKTVAAALFVTAMILLIIGLACFLREVYLATHTISFDPTRFQ